MEVPQKWMDYSGKSHLELGDDWGYPHFMKCPYMWIQQTPDMISSKPHMGCQMPFSWPIYGIHCVCVCVSVCGCVCVCACVCVWVCGCGGGRVLYKHSRVSMARMRLPAIPIRVWFRSGSQILVQYMGNNSIRLKSTWATQASWLVHSTRRKIPKSLIQGQGKWKITGDWHRYPPVVKHGNEKSAVYRRFFSIKTRPPWSSAIENGRAWFCLAIFQPRLIDFPNGWVAELSISCIHVACRGVPRCFLQTWGIADGNQTPSFQDDTMKFGSWNRIGSLKIKDEYKTETNIDDLAEYAHEGHHLKPSHHFSMVFQVPSWVA